MNKIKSQEEYQQQQKRKYLKQLMEDNLKLINYRNELKRRQRQEEIEAGKRQVEFIDRNKSYR